MMMRILLDFLLTGGQNVVLAISLCKMIHVRRPRLFLLLFFLLPSILHVLSIYVFFEYIDYKIFFYALLTSGILLAFSKDRVAKSLCSLFVSTSVMIVLEIAFSFLVSVITSTAIYRMLLNDTLLYLVVLKSLYLLAYTIMLACVVWIWRKMTKQGNDRGITLVAVLFLLSQMTLMAQVLFLQSRLDLWTATIYLTFFLDIVLCLAADILLLREIRRLRQLHQLEEKQLQIDQQMAVQETYYRLLEEKTTVVSKLRHDMNNQLQTAFSLLRKQESELAEAQLESLRHSLEETTTRRYSATPIIDAVLEDKAVQCAQQSIVLTTQPDLPAIVHIEPAALCSIITNLLDNAIRAAALCPQGARAIHCQGLAQGRNLIIEVTNTKPNTPYPNPTGHGLGLVILQDIAATYNGRLETKSNETSFTATLWLCGMETP